MAKNSASEFLGGVGFWQESQEITGITGKKKKKERKKRNPLVVVGGVGSFFSSYLGETSLRRKRGGREGGNMLEHEAVSGGIIGSAVTVHKELGPGFLESVYEATLAYELGAQGIPFDRHALFPILYRATKVRERRRSKSNGCSPQSNDHTRHKRYRSSFFLPVIPVISCDSCQKPTPPQNADAEF